MKYLLLNCLLAVLLISCQENKKPSIEIPDGKVGLIGYGSLTSSEQMASQLGRPYDGEVEVIHLEGFQREWGAPTPNAPEFPPKDLIVTCLYNGESITPKTLTVLNIRENESATVNACFFILDEEDLPVLDATEAGYGRIDVTDKIQEFDVTKGTVYAYQALPEYMDIPIQDDPREQATPQLYIDFIEAGFSELGETYKEEFYETTLPVNEALVLECEMIEADE